MSKERQLSAVELLLQRHSTPMLTSPAPSKSQLDIILQAGMAVPDHGALLPWQFIVAQNSGLDTLSGIFVDAVNSSEAEQAKVEKAAKMPYRAPLIIVVATQYQTHAKVPKQEQLVAAGCCVHAMQMAAFSLGYGAMWRTGDMAYSDKVKLGLAIDVQEDIVGFLYIGTETRELSAKPRKSAQDFTREL